MIPDSIETTDPVVVPSANPNQLLAPHQLTPLNQRSDFAGSLRLIAHLTSMGLSGYLWATTASLWIALPALFLYGISLAFMFCPTHECVHRTAFKSQWVNDTVAWLAGLLSFYNSTFYRRYHKWHHRYTKIEGKDPELSDSIPENWGQYLWHLSGIPWWQGKIFGHINIAINRLEDCYYLPESSYAEVVRSTRLQLGTYVAISLLSILLGHPWFLFTYWVIPLAVGQPFLRFVLLAEHTGCSSDNNSLTNTRSTLTLWPLQFLMWNMPFHAEHHLYPSIPFHALPSAHLQLKDDFEHIDAGYLRVNQKIVGAFK